MKLHFWKLKENTVETHPYLSDRFKITLIMSLLLIGACAPKTAPKNAVPKSWYDSDSQPPQDSENLENEKPENLEALGQSIDTLLTADSEALEEGDSEAQVLLSPLSQPLSSAPPLPPGKPADWVPWRAEYFMTDLSLTGSGLIGALTFKGTATVRAYWRRQGSKPKQTPTPESFLATPEENTPNEPIILVQEDSSPDQMVQQLEPAISAAVATGKIKDTPVLRKNLLQTAQEFQAIASNIPHSSDNLPWWVSRFRLDFTVDAAGRVEPVGLVGGEARFRFEWHRIQRKIPGKSPSPVILSERESKLRKSLRDFITATAHELHRAFDDHEAIAFKAHQIRMGLGISVKGNVGLVKGSAGVVGQIYFTRDVKRPTVYPRLLALDEASSDDESPIFLIERNPTLAHLETANQHKVLFETFSSKNSSGFEEALYRLERRQFRKGLRKAARIGKFLAKRASKLHLKSWKVYELRTAFDASISGALDLATLVGSATAQVSYFNEKF